MAAISITCLEGQLSVLRRPAPGRLRLAVSGLRRRPDREAAVEAALVRLAGVRIVSASALTGNALVLFDPSALTEDALLTEGTRLLAASLNGHSAGLGQAPARKGAAVSDGHPASGQTPSVPAGVAAGRDGRLVPRRAGLVQSEAPLERVPWHSLKAAEAARLLGTNPARGLQAADVEVRRQRHGPNRLPEPSPPSLLRLFLGRFADSPSVLLAAGAVLSLATGGIADAVLISTVLLANATIGAATERSGHRAIAALRRSVAIKARVRRDGAESVVEAGELVPGDVIKLLPGDPVPADARLTFAHRLQVEESALTGESRPADKDVLPVEVSAILAERRCMLYRGTTVVGGHGEAIVVATGGATVAGRLRVLAARAAAPPAPLERDLNVMGRTLAITAAGVCAGVFGLTVLRGMGALPAIATGISLAVAAIPEGLGTIGTTVLALGSNRMRRKGTLIRTLGAAETLGSVTVVCADKTGTITENRMVARECTVDGHTIAIGGPALSTRGSFRLAGRAVAPEDAPGLLDALRIGALCNDAELDFQSQHEVLVQGSATEGALLVAAVKAGLDVEALQREFPRVDRRDRGDGRRYMITVHRLPERRPTSFRGSATGGLIALAKGSPEEILDICDRIARGAESVPLDGTSRATILARNAEMAGRGLRVLALAARELPERYDEADLAGGFVWHGHIGLADPIRPAAPSTIQALHRAGIRTVMITGDQAQTAAAVARELNLSDGGPLRVVEGAELASASPEILHDLVKDATVFARVPPDLKLAIVRALQTNGDVVAMTGDGVNDAAALRAADVGIAMGESGTELARELADVVLSTDDLARFVDAVEEGRLLRCNVRRVLHYLLATNASEVWAVVGALVFGQASPLTPLQLLWLNMVGDFAPAIGLATEPAPPGLMRQPPRDPREPIVPRPLQRGLLGESLAISLGTLGAYGLGLLRHGPGPAARTMAFASLSGAQLLHVPLVRAPRPAGEGDVPPNRALALAIGISALLQVAAVFFPPLRAALGGARIGLADAAISLLGSALPIAAIQGTRALQAPRRMRGARRMKRVRREVGSDGF